MKQKKFKSLLLSFIILTAILLGGCGTDNNNDLTAPGTNTVSPPAFLLLMLISCRRRCECYF